MMSSTLSSLRTFRPLAHILFVVLAISLQNANAQNRDDQMLTLQALINAASNFYPSIVAAKYEAQATQEEVTVAERQRWPTVTATVESNNGNLRSGPTRSMQICWRASNIPQACAPSEYSGTVASLE